MAKRRNIVRSIMPVGHASIGCKIVQRIGKPARDGSPHFSVDDLMLHRVQPNAIEEGIDLLHERAPLPAA